MRFIVTPELGRLAKWLRILGFDTVYFAGNFSSLLIQALRDNRIILTRNSRLVNKASGVRLVKINSDEINQQLKQALDDLNIKPDQDTMFSRCLVCNAELKQIEKQKVRHRVPEYVFKTQDEFFTCGACGRIYWPGTHWGNISKILKEIT